MTTTTLQLPRAWVTKVTSDQEDDFVIAGHGLRELPGKDELSSMFSAAQAVDALREMVRRKWLPAASGNDRVKKRAESFGDFIFDIKRKNPAFAEATMFRRKAKHQSVVRDALTLAWLRHVADKADTLQCEKFSFDNLDDSVTRKLVRLSVNKNGPKQAIDLLAKVGIPVVIESSLPGMHLDGASFIDSKRGPVIGLTLRFDRVDSFWFTLLHELAHIRFHLATNKEDVFMDSLEDGDDMEDSEAEAEANAFAKDAFVPRDAWLRSSAFRLGTESAILDLAGKLKIHPAIIAGRLRFERNRYDAFASMLGSGEVRKLLIAD